METQELLQKSTFYLQQLCSVIPNRSVGSPGNRLATRFFQQVTTDLGWATQVDEFDAMDWEDGGASLRCGVESFEILPGPYSLGFDGEGLLAGISSLAELENADIQGKLVLLHGEIAKEQLMPKNFVFYNPEEHQKIISLLEHGHPKAILCATGRNPSLSGGVYPFPLIEDGDFDIPSVYMTEEEGRRLLPYTGETARLISNARRTWGKGENVLATKGNQRSDRVVVTAHIDAKKGTPGAIDNATGVTVLLLLANLLRDYTGERMIELVAFNGEDYYAVPGQMAYIRRNEGCFDEIRLNVNIDGAGYYDGKSAFSFYGLPDGLESTAREEFGKFEGLIEGPQWPQGDHSIFVQFGRPAMAMTSAWFAVNIDRQEITHTPKDNLSIVACDKLVEIAQALEALLRQ